MTIVGAWALLVSSARADRVELNTGEVFFGTILRANEHEVSIRLSGGGLLSFRLTYIRHYRRDTVVHDDWGSGSFFLDDDEWASRADGRTKYVGSRSPRSSGGSSPDAFARPLELIVPDHASPLTQPRTARPAESPAPIQGEPLDSLLVDSIAEFPASGYSLAPPKGFLRWEEDENRAVAGYFQDPVTQANLTVLAYPSNEPIETTKKKAARSYAEQVRSFRVVRDERLAGSSFEGWLFEVKSELAGSTIHQVQVFASRAGRVFVLTYSTSEKHFAKYRASFDESVRSLRLFAAPEAPPAAGSPAGETAAESSDADEPPADPTVDESDPSAALDDPPPRSLESLLEATETGR